MGSRERFRDVFAVREFRALWSAELLSVLGDQLARVGLAVLVYQQTLSAGWTALAYALTFVPALLGGVLLSGLADRLPRRELMIVVDLFRAVVACAMAVPGLPLPALMALVFVLALAAAPFKAAQQALLPQVLRGGRYEVGLALRTVTAQSAQLAGFVGGAGLLAVVDPHVALGGNAATFLGAAALVAVGVRARPVPAVVQDDQCGSGVAGAVRLVWRDRFLRGLIALSWLVGLFVVPEGLSAPYAAGLGVAMSATGLLMAADPIGSIVGAWVLSRISSPVRQRLLPWLAVASGIPLIGCMLRPNLGTVVVLWVASGAFSTAYLIVAQALFIRQVPDHRRGAASGLASTGVLTSQGIAILGGGVLADLTSAPIAVAVAGIAGVALTGSVAASWLRARHRDRVLDDRRRREAHDATTAAELTNPYSGALSTPPPTGPAAEHGMRGANPDIIAWTGKPAAHPPRLRSWLPWRWAIWTVPRRVMLTLVTVETATLALTVIMILDTTLTRTDLTRAGCLVALGVAMGELTRHVERVRRRFNDTPHINLTSVWTFCAALVVSEVLAAVVVVLLYVHLFWRSWRRVRGVHAYRLVFTASTVILSAYTASAICEALRFTPTDLAQWTRWNSVAIITLTIVAYTAVNATLIALAITLFERRVDLRRSLGTARENALEFGTLGLGALTIVPVTLHLALTLMIVPALLVLHRSVLLRQLEEAISTDPKTGLTNASAWSSIATLELERAAREGRSIGVLMIDLDDFTAVNDTYGPVAGDRVLHGIATMLTRGVRRHDLVGRWGGEEFVVLCPDVTGSELYQLGEQLCERVRHLHIAVAQPDATQPAITGLTVSIGAASYPDFGPELQDLLLAADDALFAAKDNGRGQIRVIVPAHTHTARPAHEVI